MRFKFPRWSIFGMVLVLAGIAAYNVWAYNCGYCAIQDMKNVGPQVKAVGFLVLGAIACWFVLSSRHSFNQPDRNCKCGRMTVADWSFCPDCGKQIR